MLKYQNQTRLLVAVDCIIFGFDGNKLKILLIKRGLEPKKDHWSLMGGFVQAVSGGALYRKSTFLLDSLGKKVFPKHIDN